MCWRCFCSFLFYRNRLAGIYIVSIGLLEYLRNDLFLEGNLVGCEVAVG